MKTAALGLSGDLPDPHEHKGAWLCNIGTRAGFFFFLNKRSLVQNRNSTEGMRGNYLKGRKTGQLKSFAE